VEGRTGSGFGNKPEGAGGVTVRDGRERGETGDRRGGDAETYLFL